MKTIEELLLELSGIDQLGVEGSQLITLKTEEMQNIDRKLKTWIKTHSRVKTRKKTLSSATESKTDSVSTTI